MTVRGLDLDKLAPWLANALPDRASGPLEATILAGGRSNLTYRLDAGGDPIVLRRPPLGHVQSTAHDMAREFRIISALAGTAVPVPAALRFDDDSAGDAGVGTPFYLMDFVDGRILSSGAANAAFTAEQLRQLSLDLVRSLAALHSTDPAGVGLADFGRPDGYLERQLRRWATQYDGSRNRALPALDELQEKLHERVPATTQASLLHGDFRLDNAIVTVDAAGTPRIGAILDWEMATIGDSFADLGLLGLYWNIGLIEGADAVPSAVDPAAGYPTFAELVDEYAAVRGITVPDLSWYLAFSAYKLAVILEGIHFRFQAGETVGAGFDTIG
ncbi:MAG: acyl-CoA dehydrogenase, partial [Microbacteriaceae bacterium]|nr:acyl-CoA dehydrogenase [Microbacteriaceae bacterium]